MGIALHEGDCLEVMAEMPASSVDLILTDPPYFRVKGESWDRQWNTASGFLSWMGLLVEQWHRVLRPNGSLYVFASPKMSARVECVIGERFEVLNRITWAKPCPFSAINKGASNSGRVSSSALRGYYPNSESIIFAEHVGSDGYAKGESGWDRKCDELRGFVFEPLRAYLDGERKRAGVSPRECNEALGNQMAGHYFTASQWALPTRANYESLRALFNTSGGEFLRREFEDLRRDYEDLRREFEDLRREFEDLRRPFSASRDRPFTDVWTYPTVKPYAGKHPCEKPLAMLEHIIETSSRPGGLVLDSFMGSGSTGVAALSQGREFVGIEKDPGYFAGACARLEAEQGQGRLFA